MFFRSLLKGMLASLLLAGPAIISAESESVGVHISISPLQKFELSSDEIQLPVTLQEDFERGYLLSEKALTVQIWSNTPWALSMRAVQGDMGLIGGKRKNLRDLLWRGPSENVFSPVSDEDVVIARSSHASKGAMIDLDYKVILDWVKDNPGHYQVELLMTLGAAP